MSTITPQHPAEKALLARCKEIGLDDQETALLHDLLGWNNRNGGIPESYSGIDPQLSLIREVGNATEGDCEKGNQIAQLLRNLIGKELMPLVENEPVMTLQEKLGLPRLAVVWIIAQLHIKEEKCTGIYDEISDLCTYHAPEQMPRLVIPALSALLKPR